MNHLEVMVNSTYI